MFIVAIVKVRYSRSNCIIIYVIKSGARIRMPAMGIAFKGVLIPLFPILLIPIINHKFLLIPIPLLHVM